MRGAWRPEVRLQRHLRDAAYQMVQRRTVDWVRTLLAQRVGKPLVSWSTINENGGAMHLHAQGVLLIILSTIAFSSAGFFTRLIHLDAWTMLFWRGLFAGLMILCVIIAQERRHTWSAIHAIGRPGLAAAFCSTIATVL